MNTGEFITLQRQIDHLILEKKYLEAYKQIQDLLNQQEINLTGEQIHYLLNLQSNTKYAAESQILLQIIKDMYPHSTSGLRISRDEIHQRAIAQRGFFTWTRADLERAIDYLILHDLLPAHIEGNDIVFD